MINVAHAVLLGKYQYNTHYIRKLLMDPALQGSCIHMKH